MVTGNLHACSILLQVTIIIVVSGAFARTWAESQARLGRSEGAGILQAKKIKHERLFITFSSGFMLCCFYREAWTEILSDPISGRA
jgi:hypothetical protein